MSKSETQALDNILAWIGFDKAEDIRQWLAHVIRAEEPCGCYIAFDGDEDKHCDEWQKVLDDERERKARREEIAKEEEAAKAIERMKANAKELGVPYNLLP